MKRFIVFVLLAVGGGALALSTACGAFLDVTPDDPGAGNGSANDGGGDGGDGGGATDGATEGATDDGLGAVLTPASISLVAGDTTGVTLVVSITRPTAAPTPVTVTIPAVADVIVTPDPNNDPSSAAQAFKIMATDAAVPRHETVTVIVSDGKRTALRPLTILLAHHYRTGAVTTLDVPAPQTYLIKAWGAGGGDPSGGAGGFAQGIFSLEKGTYSIVVGQGGPGSSSAAGTPGGGMPGGGSLATGGGGFSGLFAMSADGGLDFGLARLVAGAGGGGTASGGTSRSGGGGGSTSVNPAEDGRFSPGSGASANAGGVPGPSTGVGDVPGLAGTMLQGGNGGFNGPRAGGGGGGGYYGGGGGGADGTAGGGGSSFVISSAMSPMTRGGVQTTAGNATDTDRGTAGAVGGDGAIIIIPQ